MKIEYEQVRKEAEIQWLNASTVELQATLQKLSSERVSVVGTLCRRPCLRAQLIL
jgi:hypothetical protein